jgi:hypothetical protein
VQLVKVLNDLDWPMAEGRVWVFKVDKRTFDDLVSHCSFDYQPSVVAF